MRVRAAGTKRGDPRNPRQLAPHPVNLHHRATPRFELLLNHKRAARKLDVRVQPLRMQARHQLAVLHLQQRPSSPPRSPPPLSQCPMFDFTEPIAQNCLSAVPAANACVSPGDLDRIPKLGPRAVRLDIAHLPRTHPRLAQTPLAPVLLRLGIGNRVAVGLAAVIDAACRGSPHRSDPPSSIACDRRFNNTTPTPSPGT